jgi:hypothetical protein
LKDVRRGASGFSVDIVDPAYDFGHLFVSAALKMIIFAHLGANPLILQLTEHQPA